MKKILIIGLTPPVEGGSQQHILEILKNINKTKFDVTVLTQKGTLCKNDASCIEIDIGEKKGYLQSLAFYNGVKKYISSMKDFDIIHIHESYLFLLINKIKANTSAKIIITVHGLKGFKYYDNQMIWPFFKSKINRADRIIAVSKPDENIMKKYFKNIYQIPNGVDNSLYSSSEKTEKKITFIGRIHEQKGIIYLLEAFDKVNKVYPEFHLEIIGTKNDYSRELKNKFPSLNIKYLGYKGDRIEIASLLSSSYLIVLPSLWEGSPLTLFESFASGRPVIASNIQAFKDIISTGNNGLIFKTRDSDELAGKIISLIKNSALANKMGQAGKKIALKYDWKQITKITEGVYNG